MAYRRGRSLLTIIAVVLGTAVVAATFTTNAAIEDSMRRSAKAMVGNADLVVEAVGDRGFPAEVVQAVMARSEVTVVSPQLQKRTYFRTPTQRGFVELIGIDPLLDPQIRPYPIAAGSFLKPSDGRSVLLVKDWAQKQGLGVGGSIDLMTADGFQPFRVIGLLDEPDLSQRNFGGLVRVPLGVAQSTFGLDNRVQLLNIKMKNPRRVDVFKYDLEDVIPYQYLARDTPRVLDDMRGSIRDFQLTLFFFGGVALFAGGFLLLNTLSLAVAEQTRELGLLRAAGATGFAIVRMTLAQALVLGAIGSLIGVAVGQVLALGLVVAIAYTQKVAVAGIPFSWPGMVASLGLGVLVTLVASLIPALHAAEISPLMAIQTQTAHHVERPQPWRALLASLTTAALLVFAFLPFTNPALRSAKALSLLILFPLFLYLSRIFIPLLAGVASFSLRWLSAETGMLARRNITRERGRTSVTVAGFVISLSLIVALQNGAASFSSAGAAWAQSLFPGQFLVVSPVAQPGELASEFESIPGVERVSPISVAPVVWNGTYLTAVGVDPADYFQAFEFKQGERTAAFRQMQRGPAVLVPAGLAQTRKLKLGKLMTLTADDEQADFIVAGVIAHSLPSADNFGALVLPRREVEELFGVTSFRFLAISPAPDANRAQVASEVGRMAELYGMESTSIAGLQASIGRGVSSLLGLLGGLVAVGVVVGSLSVMNTMMMNITQRARELGILRAAGMTRRQVERLSVSEAAVMGFVGALLGVAAGALLTWVLVDANRGSDFDPRFTFSPIAALVVIGMGVVSAVLAALYPAKLAGRTNVVQALTET